MPVSEFIKPPVALSIAGFDPAAGAGIVADIRTFAAFGCFGTAVITSLTFQNTVGVFGVAHQTAETVRSQLLPLVEDFPIACAKTGMLPTKEVIREVAGLFREQGLPAPVVDPVIRSSSGHDLIEDDALASLTSELLPLARVVTPNIPEAERMTGLHIEDEEGMRRAARALRAMGARAALVKGGHLSGEPLDVLDDDGVVTLFHGDRVETGGAHGTGCALSAAMAACLGRGMTLRQAIGKAKRFVAAGIRSAPTIGHGPPPIDLSERNAERSER